MNFFFFNPALCLLVTVETFSTNKNNQGYNNHLGAGYLVFRLKYLVFQIQRNLVFQNFWIQIPSISIKILGISIEILGFSFAILDILKICDNGIPYIAARYVQNLHWTPVLLNSSKAKHAKQATFFFSVLTYGAVFESAKRSLVTSNILPILTWEFTFQIGSGSSSSRIIDLLFFWGGEFHAVN